MHIEESIDRLADDVRRSREGRRIHAQCLADIRRASKLTQKQVAAALDTDQGAISRIERRDDLLLSTLRQYLAATGTEHPKIVVEKDGVEISLDLDTFA
ncbi:helix-turn-helix domain-containing protein [Prescottella equi]|uniref:helix-turn-helix domain-containing protein n=1 Tax=Rhodococcus hoagii TaxID=43767 RepID=UPI003AF32A11